MQNEFSSDLVLSNTDLDVVITPGKGADIYAVIDRATGIDVLFKTPWGRREQLGIPPYGDSQADWLARYPGGWQVLLPHAGSPQDYGGGRRGYHGEAAMLPWKVIEVSEIAAVLTVELFTVPMIVRRMIRLDGPQLHVTDTLLNQAHVPVQYAWVEHPAFGPPFAGPSCRIATGAHTLISDAIAPGTVFGPDCVMPTDDLRTATGAPFDLTLLPGPETPREIFAALTDFDSTAWFSLTNDELGFGMRMEWEKDVLPHAWFWQECHATAGFPWFGRAYAVGIEPANVLPCPGRIGPRLSRQDAPFLAPDHTEEVHVTLTRFDVNRAEE